MNQAAPAGRSLPRAAGLPGVVASTWAIAGGILGGGVLVAWLTAGERMSANGLFYSTLVLFVSGAAAGFFHGAVLGTLGRPADEPVRTALRSLLYGAMYSVPGMGVSAVLAVWISQTQVTLYADRTGPTIGLWLAWAVAAGFVLWAAWLGVRALRNAYARWPDPWLGSLLVGVAFVALLTIFLADRPAIWGTRLRVSGWGTFFLAGGVTVWISGPVLSLPLILRRDLPDNTTLSHPVPRGRRFVEGIIGGLLAGGVLGLLVAWLSPYVLSIGGDGSLSDALLLSIARATIDEMLLRLFVLTGVAWLLIRWHPLHREEATVAAVVVGAIAHVLLHLGGLLGAGVTGGVLVGSMTASAFFPGLVLGAVYVLRGLPASVAAHAAMLFVLGLLA